MVSYVVATIKPWNIKEFEVNIQKLPGDWTLVTSKEELTEELIDEINPRYIFFPHWSWIVPEEIHSKYECVCFHMTDVPFGRGGSPLQNLISRGYNSTKLTALRMCEVLDAGPVYKKTCLSLEGRAEDIFTESAFKTYELIKYIVENKPVPTDQEGEVTTFSRRSVDQSILPMGADSIELIYNHIRMLDAQTYPPAFVSYGNFTVEFHDAILEGDEVLAKVIIRRNKNE